MISKRPELFSYRCYPCFVHDVSYGENNFTSLGKIKFTLVYIVKKNLEQALTNAIHEAEIDDKTVSRLSLYPIGIAEYWRQENIGYRVSETYLGLFLNKQGIDKVDRNKKQHKSLSDSLDMRKDFYLKEIKSPYGDIN